MATSPAVDRNAAEAQDALRELKDSVIKAGFTATTGPERQASEGIARCIDLVGSYSHERAGQSAEYRASMDVAAAILNPVSSHNTELPAQLRRAAVARSFYTQAKKMPAIASGLKALREEVAQIRHESGTSMDEHRALVTQAFDELFAYKAQAAGKGA
jgi:hypothetical protein